MIIKPILNKVMEHLENEYGVNTFTQSGLRLAYVVYEAYITSDRPIRMSSELINIAYENLGDNSTYSAFERSVYRELKNINEKEKNLNILQTIYNIAKGIKL